MYFETDFYLDFLVAQLKTYVISTIVELVSASKWKNVSIREDAL